MDRQTRFIVAIILGVVALGGIFGSRSMTWLETSGDGERSKADYEQISSGLSDTNDSGEEAPVQVDLWFDIGIWVSAGLVAVAFALGLTGPTGKAVGLFLCFAGLAFALLGGLGLKSYVDDLIRDEGETGLVSTGPGLIVICCAFAIAVVAVLLTGPPQREPVES